MLQLAKKHPFARKLVNSGRLSIPAFYATSSLNTPAEDPFEGFMEPGAPMDDAPVVVSSSPGWLLDQVGNKFQLMVYVDDPDQVDTLSLQALRDGPVAIHPLIVSPKTGIVLGGPVVQDVKGLIAKRYDARNGTTFLLRPDQHIAARWRDLNISKIQAALTRATGNI